MEVVWSMRHTIQILHTRPRSHDVLRLLYPGDLQRETSR
jgi:hypothetical protein